MSSYSKNANASLKSLYYKRSKYFRKTFSEFTGDYSAFAEPDVGATRPAHANLINYRFAEFNLFGKVNHYFIPITVKESSLKFFSTKVLADPTNSLRGVNFVVNVFEQMAKQFEKCVLIGRIDPSDPFLSNIKVYKAYEDPAVLYDRYFTLLAVTLKKEIGNRGIKILSLDDMMNALLEILPNGALQIPFTQTGYTKSKHCPSTCSGLVIEIADLDYNDDQEKIDLFYKSLNWDFYVQTCDSFGFVVDASAHGV